MTVGVIVVNYNGGELVSRCARAVLDSAGVELELAVSDNGSRDGSLQAVQLLARQDSRVKVVAIGANLGFAAGSNRALPLLNSGCEFVLFLNPDCIVELNTIALMADAMRDHPAAGIAGCLIRNPDGSEQRGCRRLMPTPANALVRVFKLDQLFPRRFKGFDLTGAAMPVTPVEVEAISGAFMFVRRSAFEVVGPLDEGYFLHCEDLDWCMRFTLAGWKVLFVPGAIATHAQGASSKSIPVRVEWHKHRGMLRFYGKFQRDAYGWPLYALVATGVWLRFLLKTAWLTARRSISR